MTGGEIFARPDFRELYLYAKELGFVLSLYTNATLVDESIIDFLVKYPPRRIEVTIYGHTEKVYEAITGVMGSFVRFRRGVDLMLAAGLSVRLKTMVLKTNLCEFDAMRDWSLEKTGSFRYDANVGPKLDQDNAPLRERISPREYLSVEQRDSVNREQYLQVTELVANLESGKDLFMCGTGVLTIHVDPRGLLHPCMLWRKGGFNLLERDAEEWGAHLASLRSAKNPEGGCNSCSNRGSCGRCPATCGAASSSSRAPSCRPNRPRPI
jgi:MoaA/NifB/PqqE/SkfB family radical SAM enzyme